LRSEVALQKLLAHETEKQTVHKSIWNKKKLGDSTCSVLQCVVEQTVHKSICIKEAW